MNSKLYDYLVGAVGVTNYFSLTAMVQESDPLEILVQPAQTIGDTIRLKIYKDGRTEVIQ